MGQIIRVRISVTPYRWNDFVNDIAWAAVVCYVLTNEITKKVFRRSVRQIVKLIPRLYWLTLICIWTYLIIGGILEQP